MRGGEVTLIDAISIIVGLVVSLTGFLGSVLTYSIDKVSNIVSNLLARAPSVGSGTVLGFFTLFLSGILMVVFSSIPEERRPRALCTLSFFSSSVSAFVFLYKTVFLGPSWFSIELVGRSGGPLTSASIAVTLLAVFTFFFTLSRLALEMT